jgi:hypothetical protein
MFASGQAPALWRDGAALQHDPIGLNQSDRMVVL